MLHVKKTNLQHFNVSNSSYKSYVENGDPEVWIL